MAFRRILPIVSGLTVAAAIWTGVWVLDRLETSNTLAQQRARVADQVTGIRAKIEAALYGRLYLARGMSAFVRTHGEFSEAEFNTYARELQGLQQGIRSLQLAPGAVVTYIYPFAGNEAAMGHDLRADPDRRDAVERAIAGRQFIVAGPVELRQGGVALIARLPIFLPAPMGAPGESRFWGFSIVLIDLEPLLKEGGVFDPQSGVRIAVRGKDGLGAEGDVFFGDEGIFAADPIAFDVTLPNGSWQVAAIPNEGWSGSWHGREWLLGGGGALALLAGLLIFYLLKRPMQLSQAVSKAISALHESDELNAMILDTAADAIITIDGRGLILSFNRTAEGMFSYAADEVIGRDVKMLMAGPYHDQHGDYLANYLETGEKKIIGIGREVEGRRKDGSCFPMDLALGEAGLSERRLFTGIMRDISKRKQAEAELREAHDSLELRVLERTADLDKAKEQAEHANRAKSEFLATMSHELRTPLNAILGFSEITKDEKFGPLGSVKYREYADDIHRSGQLLLDLINDILDLSKVESGSGDLFEENINIPAVVRSVMMLVTGRAQQGGIELESNVAEDVPELRADQRRLKQILVNLLSNAIKFTPAGGKVALKAWCRADSGFVLQVIDNGIGIAPEDIPMALAPFQQIDSDLNRKYEGTGLGLPLAKALVEQHGGSLDLQSEFGVGTTVTVRFPAERVAKVNTRVAFAPVA